MLDYIGTAARQYTSFAAQERGIRREALAQVVRIAQQHASLAEWERELGTGRLAGGTNTRQQVCSGL